MLLGGGHRYRKGQHAGQRCSTDRNRDDELALRSHSKLRLQSNTFLPYFIYGPVPRCWASSQPQHCVELPRNRIGSQYSICRPVRYIIQFPSLTHESARCIKDAPSSVGRAQCSGARGRVFKPRRSLASFQIFCLTLLCPSSRPSRPAPVI